jgi:hypothetical protein
LTDKKQQNEQDKSTGENHNGRKSPFKNYNPNENEAPNEFLNQKSDEADDDHLERS